MLIGILAEGHDHLILHAFLERLLGMNDNSMNVDHIEGAGHGWQFVLDNVPRALHRFYARCACAAVVAIDNDGNMALDESAQQEDARRPRHWNHRDGNRDSCRWCRLTRLVEAERPRLHWIANKPGDKWPVVVGVPVESIEAWLLASRAILNQQEGDLRAEHGRRAEQKQKFYGMPAATLRGVTTRALPIVRAMSAANLADLRDYSRSLDLFAESVERQREAILGCTSCW